MDMNERMNWVEVAAVDEIPEMGSRVVEADELKIALFHLRGGQVRAVDNHCPHKGGPLAEGIVAGEFVYCPLHDWKVNLRDGAVQEPETGCVRTYPVDVTDGKVFVLLPEFARA